MIDRWHFAECPATKEIVTRNISSVLRFATYAQMDLPWLAKSRKAIEARYNVAMGVPEQPGSATASGATGAATAPSADDVIHNLEAKEQGSHAAFDESIDRIVEETDRSAEEANDQLLHHTTSVLAVDLNPMGRNVSRRQEVVSANSETVGFGNSCDDPTVEDEETKDRESIDEVVNDLEGIIQLNDVIEAVEVKEEGIDVIMEEDPSVGGSGSGTASAATGSAAPVSPKRVPAAALAGSPPGKKRLSLIHI